MRPLLTFLLALASGACFPQSLPPIGQWREHLPWNNAIQVARREGTIIAATPYALFEYERTASSFRRWSRMSGLSDIGVSAMALDPVSGKVVVAYRNSNVDVLDKDKVVNIPDIRVSNVQGDKSVNRIISKDNKAWLCAGLGIIVVDLLRNEVSATWRPSATGASIPVYGLAFHRDSIYAACSEGVRRVSARDDASNFRNWSSADTAIRSKADHILSTGSALFALVAERILKWNGAAFVPVYTSPGRIVSADTGGMSLLVSEVVQGKGRVAKLDQDGRLLKLYQPNDLSLPRQALEDGNTLWVADGNNGLISTTGTASERVFPNSPINTASGEMKFINGTLWAAAGSVNEAWNYLFNPNGIYRFRDDRWDGYNLYVYPKIDSMLDFVTVTGQPSTGNVYAGSYGGGLLELTPDGKLNIFKQNSPLRPAIGDPASYRVSGLATDLQNNIWISNFGAERNLHVRKADGQWRSFTVPFFHQENAVAGITIDPYDQKWIVSPKGNGLFVLNSGASIDNTNDDSWRYFRKGKGAGNLPSNTVYCAVRDRNGFIWVGTDRGIAVITCGPDATRSNCDATIPIVQQDNFAGFLFQDEEVICMEVDGANRKWVGTKNGLWLVSEQGDRVIFRFTRQNSPLLSDEINALAMDQATGELFISTASGICSFRGTATEGGEKAGDVLVFPNPVPPGFTGTIGIRGLAVNALVKITGPDGRLVYQARAQGGQATWNGRDQKGERVSSGAYLVFSIDEQNRERMVSKIFFIR